LKTAVRTQHIALLDALRALAILFVIANHTLPGITRFFTRWQTADALGFWGVDVFFGLSGFLLSRPYLDAAFGRRRFPSVTSYARRRFLRIWPAYAASIVISALAIVLLSSRHQFAFADVFVHLVMLQNFFPAIDPAGVNGPLWTMATDTQFYIVLPISAWLLSKYLKDKPLRFRYGTLAVAIIASIAFSIAWRAYVTVSLPPSEYYNEVQRNVIGAGMCFDLGIAACMVETLGVRISRAIATLLLAIGVLLFALVLFFDGLSSGRDFIRIYLDILGSLSVATLILGGLNLRSHRLDTFLNESWVKWLADHAYALYLVHKPVILCVEGFIGLHSTKLFIHILQPMLLLAMTPLLAILLHKYVEEPFLRLKDRNREITIAQPIAAAP